MVVLEEQSDNVPYHLVPREEETPHNQHLQTENVDDMLETKKNTVTTKGQFNSVWNIKIQENMSIKWASSTTTVSIISVWMMDCDISSTSPNHITGSP